MNLNESKVKNKPLKMSLLSNTRSPTYMQAEYAVDRTGAAQYRRKAIMKALSNQSFEDTSLNSSITIGPDSEIGFVTAVNDDFPTEETMITSTLRKQEPEPSNSKAESVDSFYTSERLAFKTLVYEMEKRNEEDISNEVAKKKLESLKKYQEGLEILTKQFKESLKLNEMQRIQKEETLKIEANLRAEQVAQEQLKKFAATLCVHSATSAQSISKLVEARKRKQDEDRQRFELQKNRIDQILTNQRHYNAKYQEVLDLIKNCKDSSLLKEDASEEMEKLQIVNEELLKLVESCKGSQVTDEQVDLSLNAVKDIENIRVRVKEASDKINEDFLHSENVTLEQLVKEDSTTATTVPPNLERSSNYEKRLEVFKYAAEFLEKTENDLKPFLTDPSLKKFRSDCNMAVNTPVNAISDVSPAHLEDKLNRLSSLLAGSTVSVSDGRVNASVHPLGVLYCTYVLARKIVKQGEEVVSSKPDAAYPLAALVNTMIVRYLKLAVLLMGFFFKVCPYLVPIYFEREPNLSEQEYFNKLGFLTIKGETEDIDKFLKRQSGVMRLYSAMIVSPVRKRETMGRLIGIHESWYWIVSFIQLPPRADISATLLHELLDITGNCLLKQYKRHFQKLLHIICREYIPLLEKVSTAGRGGAVVRLKTFLETVVKQNTIPPPKGILSPSFW